MYLGLPQIIYLVINLLGMGIVISSMDSQKLEMKTPRSL